VSEVTVRAYILLKNRPKSVYPFSRRFIYITDGSVVAAVLIGLPIGFERA